ncbi:glycerate kinase [Companilactobacillus nuruki]|uniref:Glycerate kinase n=1 Tax=Companilactobacillus nuruki TaxID=1993540 RepID=A0A2N7ARD1_9LACO|nr:glycerate kinase [Companilactobacillus nuruki]PMD67904.1 glycerate kinase [Companilactobacillus nuruki]
MKFIIAPGKYNNHVSSTKISQAIYNGISHAMPEAEIVTMPVTDSKYGMPALVAHTLGGHWIEMPYFDAFWNNKKGRYLITKIDSQDTAIIDSEQVVGVDLAKNKTRDQLFHATSYGIGEFIMDAVTSGLKNIVLCLGKTAVADGGLGVLQALGARIYNETGELIPEGENPLIDANRIDMEDVYELLGQRTKITVLLNFSSEHKLRDTVEYLNEAQESFLGDNLVYITEKMNQKYNLDIHPMPHSDSIKTLAGAFAMINAHISRSSFEWVAKVTGMNETIHSADIIVMATDKISIDTINDDVLYHISSLSNSEQIPNFVLCNDFIDDFQDNKQLFTGIFSTRMTELDDETTLLNNYESVANQLIRTLLTFQ